MDTFKTRIKQSLENDNPVILHAKTEFLSYYDGHASAHYIVIKAYNTTNGNVLLSDCNYSDDYFGEFSVPIEEVFNSLYNPETPRAERYIIYA